MYSVYREVMNKELITDAVNSFHININNPCYTFYLVFNSNPNTLLTL